MPTASSDHLPTSPRMDDDDDDALPLEEQYNRPPDKALHQQRIPAWNPILDPVWVILALFYLGIILVPTGFAVQDLSNSVVELSVTYDDYTNASAPCGINTTYNAKRNCTLTLIPDRDMKPPILVHYRLDNFHQNHRNYYKNKDDYQLLGQPDDQQSSLNALQCQPLNQLGNIKLNPCGLIANTFFNDIFRLQPNIPSADGTTNLQMVEEGIAWSSDILYKFKQPDGFNSSTCPNAADPINVTTHEDGSVTGTCDPDCCSDPTWSCTQGYYDAKTEQCYRYHYPNEETTQYLYETYPGKISPLDGVKDEHFIVWMRIATLPTFRKLYGYINEPIAAGTPITFYVQANYVVESFQGTKTLVVSTNNIFGGKNPFFGYILMGCGFVCLAAGLFFSLKHWCRPRQLADKRYLKLKEQ